MRHGRQACDQDYLWTLVTEFYHAVSIYINTQLYAGVHDRSTLQKQTSKLRVVAYFIV